MSKVGCSDNLGVDIDRVIAWRRIEDPTEGQYLRLYFSSGDGDTFEIFEGDIGCQAFSYFRRILLERFPVNLAGENNLLLIND